MAAEPMDRRRFLRSSAVGVAAGAAAALAGPRAYGANERLILGFMGCGGRGTGVATELLARNDIEIAWTCDAEASRAARLAEVIEKRTGKRPKTTQDFRQILEDRQVNALFSMTPDHWHSLSTILACQAGKDVYVEKPLSHNLWEGRQAVKAARKYNRIVQVGLQGRSAPYIMAGIEYLRSGKLGHVHFVRVLNMKMQGYPNPRPNAEPPKSLNYDTWLGPAPMRPYNPVWCPSGWNWFWDFSGGDIINDGVHQMDIARWLIGRTTPRYAVATGGRYLTADSAAETPDTQSVLYDYGDLTMQFDLALWTPYLKKIPQNIRMSDTEFPDWRFCATRIEVYGTQGLMMMGRHGGGWQVYDADGKVVAQNKGRFPAEQHYANFLECVRSRRRPNGDVEEGHFSTVLCHLGNISLRVGGRRLEYDGAKEAFVGDEQANALLKRAGRAPWRIPEEV